MPNVPQLAARIARTMRACTSQVRVGADGSNVRTGLVRLTT
ncbi:hypothetical protein MYA_5111 [Burkholderia sp. KJ006]|nr:hypothetical protein MYA_5111 [Burkholderia sp. KJ006]